MCRVALAFACPNSEVQRFLGLRDPWHLPNSLQMLISRISKVQFSPGANSFFLPELLQKWPSTDLLDCEKLSFAHHGSETFLTMQAVFASLVMKIMPFDPSLYPLKFNVCLHFKSCTTCYLYQLQAVCKIYAINVYLVTQSFVERFFLNLK